MYRGRRVFRPGRPMLLMVAGATALFAAGAVMTYRARGWTWVSVFLAGATLIFGLGGIIETLILRVELTDDAMVVTDWRGRRRYPIAEIDRIEEAKGVSPVLVLKDRRVVTLPSVGSSLGNSVRAWLKDLHR
jgi:hypothetical protein